MKRILALILIAGFSGGCFVHTGPSHHHGKNRSAKKGGCKPSQYWDGHKCRHKGKGHGARKHDD